jgi:hypothetical protein
MKQPSKQNKLSRVNRKIDSLKSKLSNPNTPSSKVNSIRAEIAGNRKKLKELKGAGAGIATYSGPRKKFLDAGMQRWTNNLARANKK